MKNRSILFALSLLPLLLANYSHATITSGSVTSGSGTFKKLTIPFIESNPDNTVGNNTFQDTNLYGFDEGQNIELLANLSVDILANGLGGGSGIGNILTGTIIASHYVFFDPNGTASQEGYVNFDSDILGVITSTGRLGDSDFLLNNGVTYLNPGLRGLESGDSVTITGLKQISVDWTASTPGDYVRVLTAYSPAAANVPDTGSSLGMLLGSLGLFVALRSRFGSRG